MISITLITSWWNRPTSWDQSWHARWPHKCSALQLRCLISFSRLSSPWNPMSDSEEKPLYFLCAVLGHSPPPLQFFPSSASDEWRTMNSPELLYLRIKIHLKMAGSSSRLVSRPAHRSPSFSSNSLDFFSTIVPIFIVAKKSGANVGVKREAAIAKNIALLLCTNLILFAVPVVLNAFGPTVMMDLNNGVTDDWRSFTLADLRWVSILVIIFPVMCLSINSLLNPFLYALRHPKVKQQLNPLLSRCWTATRECFGTLRQNLRCQCCVH